MNSKLRIFFWLAAFFVPEMTFAQSNVSFPKEIVASTGQVITIYQPQPEGLTGNKISGRAAVSIRKAAKEEPVFGAIFFKATISTDKNNRIAEIDSLDITNAKFSGIDDTARLQSFINLVEAEVPKWNMRISLDDLVASIKKENAGTSDEVFNNNPPKVYYRNKPTTLVILDGEPKIQKDKDLDADRVVNTPSLIFKEGSQWNMYTGGIWYKSKEVKSGWSQNKSLSKKVKSVDEQIKKQEAKNMGTDSTRPEPTVTDILVSTVPSELLQTKGEANYKTIQGTSLLYASNSTNQIFKDINTQKTYTLLSGRWYSAPNLEGPWTYVSADKLPADFSKIPEGSEKDEVLANVAGTPAAEEAKIDAQIPQTAKVDRKKSADLKIKYDGSPKFKAIEGTSLQLAENANITVMKDASGKYFAVDNGIWYTSSDANGPWAVSDDRPKEVDKIPASSSAYNTKYVYVYESTPQYVYVGYTPGYMGCYVYGPTVVYGTGFYYPPWVGAVYYPAPVTWGFGFSYNPWYGWSMNFGFSYGFMSVGFSFGFGYGGWYGPGRYYPPYRPPYYGGGYYGGGNRNFVNNGNIIINNGGGGNRVNHYDNNRNNLYNNRNGVSTLENRRGQSINNGRPSQRPGGGGPSVNNNLPGQRPGGGGASANNNLPGQRPGGGGASANNNLPSTRPAGGAGGAGGANRGPGVNNQLPASGGNGQMKPGNGQNNVFADRNGNVYQKDNKGNWNQRDNQNKSWKPAGQNNAATNNLNRESQARDRGNMRTNNFNQQRSTGSYNRGGGGGAARGGGGRRGR